jgi:CHAT domain-containing protein/tetratricopeptide (TPR) repeat protein
MAVQVSFRFRLTVLIVGMLTILGFFGNAQVTEEKTLQRDSISSHILIINSFDALSLDVRKNKKALFSQLADTLKQLLYARIEPPYQSQTIIIPGLFRETANQDSSVFLLMDTNNASMAIVIKNIDVHFEQTGVEVTGEKNNKTRTASYDICSKVVYDLYNSETKPKELEISIREFYTERDVISGFLAAGPDVVGKRKDVVNIIARNADKLFLSSDLRNLSDQVNRNNWKISRRDTALKYSLSFADQSQMVYEGGLKLKVAINKSFIESGDIAYYNGKYFNSRVRYWMAFQNFPNGLDTGYFNNEAAKMYSRLTTTIGMLWQTRGKFVKAEELQTLSMNLRLGRFGRNSPEYINSVHNLAVLKKDMGMYDEADSIFNYLTPVFERLFGTNSLEYVVLLNNKAMLLAELGRTKEASQLLDEALKKAAVILDKFYFDYERILTNKALLEQESGNIDKAEAAYQQVLNNMEEKGYDDHPDYNNVLIYYGSLRVQKDDPDLLGFLSKVIDKVKKRYGENHPLTAKALINKGDYYLNKKSYVEARNVYNEAAAIQLKTLGEKHMDYLNSLMKSGVCEWNLHDIENATVHLNKAMHNYLDVVKNLFHSMSETEKSRFWKTLKPNIDIFMAFAAENGKQNPALLKDAYNLQLTTKGILINSTRRTKNLILNSADSTLRRLYNEWLGLKSVLSVYYASPLEDLEEDKIDLPALEQHANELEKELSMKSSQFSSAYNPPDISFDDIRAKLNKEEIAVEIIRVLHYYGNQKGESEYVALVVKRDSLNPILLRIGKGKDLERDFLSEYKKSIRNKVADKQSYINYWQPLDLTVDKHKTIFVSVDGVYNSINLNTLQQHDGRYVLDDYNIVLVSNTRTIADGLKSKIKMPENVSKAVLLGAPLYGNDEIIPPLPGTREEIEGIHKILRNNNIKTEILVDQNASEQNIKSTAHPYILHVATHGFFNENVDLTKSMSMGVQVSKAKDNALLRSGLLFNDAASVYTKNPILDGSDNGILYAYEAMNLNLQNTRLVVLSACETGVGEVVNGEGVYGLSRSFQVAGAEKILMSLWKVDDRSTRELMITFYENWLRFDDPQQAFLQAQKTIKEKYPQPFYWGAFVLLN